MTIHYVTYDPETGVIQSCHELPETTFDKVKNYLPGAIWMGQASPFFNYIDLKTKQLAAYTPEEIEARASLQGSFRNGLVWKMPERKIVDMRSDEDKAAHALEDVRQQRRVAYPGLEVLADAIYWQSKGDNSKMEAYLLACEQVKVENPKPIMD